ncbi:hypothetical protein G5I_02504 [Acromyrmex echinatior]|uniref:Uncharacterized protein n=1 Tax=Acromyrmex echinatior TaxID=103372 RepID=F4WAG8_ACREC|nr:hypothetical protein G5I_02504 [Acromyrmex echinatior]
MRSETNKREISGVNSHRQLAIETFLRSTIRRSLSLHCDYTPLLRIVPYVKYKETELDSILKILERIDQGCHRPGKSRKLGKVLELIRSVLQVMGMYITSIGIDSLNLMGGRTSGMFYKLFNLANGCDGLPEIVPERYRATTTADRYAGETKQNAEVTAKKPAMCKQPALPGSRRAPVRNTNVSIQCWKCPLEDETQVAGNSMQGNWYLKQILGFFKCTLLPLS